MRSFVRPVDKERYRNRKIIKVRAATAVRPVTADAFSHRAAPGGRYLSLHYLPQQREFRIEAHACGVTG
jgi:hypothetical protein